MTIKSPKNYHLCYALIVAKFTTLSFNSASRETRFLLHDIALIIAFTL